MRKIPDPFGLNSPFERARANGPPGDPPPVVVTSDTFDDETGTGPTDWTAEWVTTPPWTETGGQVVRTPTSTARSALSRNGVSATDVEMLIKVQSDGTSGAAGVVLRGGGAAAAETGYRIQFNSGTQLQIARFVAGVSMVLLSPAFTRTSGVMYWLRARIEGSTISWRVWADGAAEPGTWTGTLTDATIAGPGWIGLACAGTTTIRFDQASWEVL